jgi:hypothetical protein
MPKIPKLLWILGTTLRIYGHPEIMGHLSLKTFNALTVEPISKRFSLVKVPRKDTG